MLHVYINYPNARVTVHGDSNCANIRQANKPNQRIANVTLVALSNEIAKFANKTYSFAANPKQNDIWLELNLDDAEFEKAVAAFILKQIARHYKPMRSVKPSAHC